MTFWKNFSRFNPGYWGW